ncbi:unnamed protein product, partial [Prorocentrum cordatum]
NANLRRRLGATEQRLAAGISIREPDAAAYAGAGAAPKASQLLNVQMVDARQLSKPRAFTGLRSEWKTWAFDFEADVFAVHPCPGKLIHQASLTADVGAPQGETGATPNAQLSYILVSLASDVAKVDVRKAPRGDGQAAWWHLVREFAPDDANRFAAMLGRIIHCGIPDPAMASLSDFEQMTREYMGQSGDVFSDDMSRGVVVSGIENETLADQLGLRAPGLATCEELKTELRAICSAQRHWAAPGSDGDGAFHMPASLAPAVDATRAAAPPAQMQLRQSPRRGAASTSSTVQTTNISVLEEPRGAPSTPEKDFWQVGMLYDPMQCDALPVALCEMIECDWALFDAGSELATRPMELASATETPPPKTPPLCESATDDEAMSIGARVVSAKIDGAPLQIEFQVANVQRAIVGFDAFAENGHAPILG